MEATLDALEAIHCVLALIREAILEEKKYISWIYSCLYKRCSWHESLSKHLCSKNVWFLSEVAITLYAQKYIRTAWNDNRHYNLIFILAKSWYKGKLKVSNQPSFNKYLGSRPFGNDRDWHTLLSVSSQKHIRICQVALAHGGSAGQASAKHDNKLRAEDLFCVRLEAFHLSFGRLLRTLLAHWD